jgi:hypothetical protein
MKASRRRHAAEMSLPPPPNDTRRKIRHESEHQPDPATDLQTAQVHLDCTAHARF